MHVVSITIIIIIIISHHHPDPGLARGLDARDPGSAFLLLFVGIISLFGLTLLIFVFCLDIISNDEQNDPDLAQTAFEVV